MQRPQGVYPAVLVSTVCLEAAGKLLHVERWYTLVSVLPIYVTVLDPPMQRPQGVYPTVLVITLCFEAAGRLEHVGKWYTFDSVFRM